MNLKQKVLMSVGTLGVAAAVAAGGSFATFSAQTTNAGNTFATGTLVMSNKVNTGTACMSTGGGTITTNAANCAALFSLSLQKPGDSATANLTIKNEGSVAASLLNTFTTGCTDGDASSESYHGNGLPCSAVQLYIQQTNSSFAPTACLYGGGTATTCDYSNTMTLADFASQFTDSGHGLGTSSGLAAGASDYFVIGVKLPDSADNSFQGRQATVGLTWFMQ